jgi:hypothetical protein
LPKSPKSVHWKPISALKKITAICFLAVLAFNCVGYRFVFDYLERRSSNQLDTELDEGNYNENALISIKTAISVPYGYLNKSTEFERWNGEIEIEGVKYHYVKRSFFNDSIELLCIPNLTATQVKNAKTEFLKSVNDQQNIPGKQDQGKIPSIKNFLGEFFQPAPQWCFSSESVYPATHSSYQQLVSQYEGEPRCHPPDAS